MDSLIKKFATCFTTVMLASSMTLTATAEMPLTETADMTINLVNESFSDITEYLDFANKWAINAYDTDVEIDQVIEVVDAIGNNAGYCISYSYNFEPMGYIIVDKANETWCVKEYALSGNNLYDEIASTYIEKVTKTNSLSNDISVEKKLHNVSGIKYAINIFDGEAEAMLTTDGDMLPIIQYNEMVSKLVDNGEAFLSDSKNNVATFSNADGMVDELTGTSVTAYNLPSLSSFTPLADDDYDKEHNNCKFIAASNVFAYLTQKQSKHLMCGNAQTKLTATYERIEELRNQEGSMPKAFGVYLNEKGYTTATVKDYGKGTTFEQVNSEIRDNNPVYIYLTPPTGVSHAVVGCGTDVRYVDGGPHFYIRIMDGWNKTSNRYIEPTVFYTSIRGMVLYF